MDPARMDRPKLDLATFDSETTDLVKIEAVPIDPATM